MVEAAMLVTYAHACVQFNILYTDQLLSRRMNPHMHAPPSKNE